MTSAAASNRKSRTGRWRRWLWSLGAAAGLLSVIPGAGPSPVAAQGVDYRSASAAPAAWRDFARQLQSRFQDRLAADDRDARAFGDYMAKRDGDNATVTLVVRSWISPDGKIERVEFDGLDDDGAAVNLRALLMKTALDAPPPDMLQPVHLRLSLRPKEQPRQGG